MIFTDIMRYVGVVNSALTHQRKAICFVWRKIISDGRGRKCHNSVLSSHIFPVFVCSVPPACVNSHCVGVDRGLVRAWAEDVGCLGTACFLLRSHRAQRGIKLKLELQCKELAPVREGWRRFMSRFNCMNDVMCKENNEVYVCARKWWSSGLRETEWNASVVS